MGRNNSVRSDKTEVLDFIREDELRCRNVHTCAPTVHRNESDHRILKDNLLTGGAVDTTPTITLKGFEYLPIVGLVLGCLTLTLPFSIAYAKEDVPLWLPFISDTGGDPPQSSIFALLTITIGVMYAMAGYAASLSLLARNHQKNKMVETIRQWVFYGGIGMAFGGILFGSNPTGVLRRDMTWLPVIVPHILGASFFVTSGCVMWSSLTYCAYLLNGCVPTLRTKIRGFFLIVLAISVCGVIMTLPLSHWESLAPSKDHGRIYPPGCELCAFFEWVIMITFMLFTTTYIDDLRRLTLVVKVDYN